MRRSLRILIAFPLFLTVGCMTEPALDKAKFSELFQASQDLNVTLRSGVPCGVPEAAVQRLAQAAAALRNRIASQPERDLLKAYVDLVAICQDAQLLCRSRAHLTGFEFVPKGRIYVTQELDPLVEKYDLATEKHVYGPTGIAWRSISADSIAVIWERASVQIRNIEVLQKYS